MSLARVFCWLLAAAAFLGAQTPPERITIEQAGLEALANNANLLAEQLNVPLATARLVTARLRPNLVLTLDGDYLDLETDMLEPSRQIRRTVEESYRAGKVSLLEFLDGQRAYTDTMQSYNDARANYARSLYAMEAATGQNVAGVTR
jgi:hypothetical protein